MGKPLNLPFHSYITVADTFLSGGRMSFHTRTYEGPRGKQEVRCRLTGQHEEVTCWPQVFHPCGFCTLTLQEPQSKASQLTAKYPSLLQSTPACCKVSQPTAKYPSLLKSIPACCKVPQSAVKYPSLLESIPVCWKVP